MTHRVFIFLEVAAFFMAGLIFHPTQAEGVMSKETLLSFNKGGMDLIPDVRVMNTQGSVTYTLTVKGQKKDGEEVLKADIVVENTHTRSSTKARVHYRASGKYVYESKGCVKILTLQSDETVIELPADSYAMAPMYTSKKKGIARFKLPDFASGFPPKYTARSSGCGPSPPDSGEFHDIGFLYGGVRIPSFGITNTEFAQSLNHYEHKATAEELSGFVEANFDGKRSRGAKTFDLIDGMTPPFFKASGGEMHEGLWKATLTVSWDLGEEGETTINIVSPKPDDDQVFKSGKLIIKAEARVDPSKYEKDVVWEIEDVQGSKKNIKPAKGSNVTITFDKLPSDNNQFGEKTITASVNGKQDQVKVRIFFERDAKDNPEGKNPNWFYYWKQDVVSGLERFEYDRNSKNPYGEYDFEAQKLIIGPKGADTMIAIQIPSKKVERFGRPLCSSQPIGIPRTEGIDTVARIVSHELEHETLLRDSGGGKNRAIDRDNDLVRDKTEEDSPYCLSGSDPNTLKLTPQFLGFSGDPKVAQTVQGMLHMTGDGELLAIAAEQKYSKRVKYGKDWASPGSQSKKAR